MSGQNIQSIINANIGRRKSAEAASRRSARLQNPNTKKRRSSPKSMARKAAGQKALKRAGTGCIVKSMKNRAGAKDTLAYCSENDKNELIFSNCGSDNGRQEATMNAVANLRPDCAKNTGHISISLAKNNASFTPEKWRELVMFALEELQIDTDNFASAAYLHKDTKNQHIHICYSLIGYDSKINFSHNIGDLGIATAQKIEVKFGLILTPRNDKNQGKKPPTQGMLERYRKTGEPPKLVMLQASIDAALEGSTSMDEFQQRLELLGVNAKFNLQEKDGKPHVSGVTYAFNDNSFKASASALGDRYGLYSLKKKGLVYDPTIDPTIDAAINAAINERFEATSEPADNRPVSQENAGPFGNDNGRHDAADQEPTPFGFGNSDSAPAEPTQNAAERRKLKREAERAAQPQSTHNIIYNRVVNSDSGDSALAKIKAQQAANVNAWEKAEAQNAIDQKLEQLQKRVSDAQAFKLDRFKYDSNLPNKFKHLVIKDLQTTDEATIAEKEAAVVEALLASHSADEIVSVLCKHSLLHKPIPEPIQLHKNAPAVVLEMAKSVQAEREAAIVEAKAIVEKAKRELEALQKRTKPAPQTDSGWKPPELGM